MASTETAHTNSVGQTFTLAAGNNSWPAMLAAAGITGLALGHVSFSWRVESGGPVSWGKRVLTAATDGAAYAVGEGDSEQAVQGNIIDGSQINFWDAAGGGGSVISVRASNR